MLGLVIILVMTQDESQVCGCTGVGLVVRRRDQNAFNDLMRVGRHRGLGDRPDRVFTGYRGKLQVGIAGRKDLLTYERLMELRK